MRTIALLLTGSALFGADLTGTWKVVVEHDLGGKKSESKFELVQKRTVLTGTYEGPFGKMPLTGEVRDARLSITIKPPKDATFVLFQGKIESEKKISGKVMFSGDYGSDFSGVKQ